MQEDSGRVLAELTRDHFESRVGEVFLLMTGEGEEAMELTVVETRRLLESMDFAPGERHPFSVIFRGPAEPILHQRIYQLSHGEMGAFPLFLVPLGPGEGGGIRYEAVFT